MAKTRPIGVRFDLEKLEIIQKEQNLRTPQGVVNFLMANYGKIRPIQDVFDTDKATYQNFYKEPVNEPENNNPEPPPGLFGIALLEWKDKNWK